MLIDFNSLNKKYKLSHHSSKIIHNYLLWLSKNINLKNKKVLDVGGGSGLISYFSFSQGADKVINLEPFSSGSREHKKIKSNLVELVEKSFQDFESKDKFDVIFFHDSINHIDENKFLDLHVNQENYDHYVKLISKINSICSKNCDIIVSDCSRYNFFQFLGLRSPFAPSIGWKYHQSTKIVNKLFNDAGFEKISVRWSPLKRLGRMGYIISFFGAPVAYFFQSHYVIHFKPKKR